MLACVRAWAFACIRVRGRAYGCVCTCVRANVFFVCTHSCARLCMCACACICPCVCVRASVHAFACECEQGRMRMQVCVCVHACINLCSCVWGVGCSSLCAACVHEWHASVWGTRFIIQVDLVQSKCVKYLRYRCGRQRKPSFKMTQPLECIAGGWSRESCTCRLACHCKLARRTFTK